MKKLQDISFSLRFRALYNALPYDQRDLARKVGVTTATILKWEDGDAVPDLIQLKKIAQYFGLPCEYFLEDSLPAEEQKPQMADWQIADALGLSEGTVERLRELSASAPGDALDALDEAIYSMTEAMLASRADWNEA